VILGVPVTALILLCGTMRLILTCRLEIVIEDALSFVEAEATSNAIVPEAAFALIRLVENALPRPSVLRFVILMLPAAIANPKPLVNSTSVSR